MQKTINVSHLDLLVLPQALGAKLIGSCIVRHSQVPYSLHIFPFNGNMLDYDDILEELGELGPWQILHVLLLWLPPMAGGIIVLTYSFTGT